ncbi:B12-binding domain-containing radical SAM protein [Myxococcota bacterium]|nr:B12-binding domain-containing radical SAM protein [Myxococcota bacterium]
MTGPRLDLLLTHAYFLADDPHEQELCRPFPPLGIQYVVAWLRRAGFSAVDWFDSTFQPGPAALLAHVADADPRVVGLYGHTVTRPVARDIVARLVEQGRRVIAGGPDPAQYVEEYLDMGVEVLVIGEGERTLQELMEHLAGNGWRWRWEALSAIPGIAFRDPDGRQVRTAPRPLIRPLEQIPWPYRDRRDLSAYLETWRARHGETALSMITSRGCPFHCSWCSKQVYGDSYRRRDVDDVIDEMAFLKQTFQPDQIWFADDLFTINRRWVHRFCRRVVERGLQTPFYLIGRPGSLDPAMCDALRRAGCYRMYLSAESGAQHVLDAMRKDGSVEQILQGARLLRAHGIQVGVFVMLGYPGETPADVTATMRMLHEVQPEVTLLSLAHPMKGTAFYDQVADRIERPPGWERANGGRLAFRMDLPRRYYDCAQRWMHAEGALVRRLRQGELDLEVAALLARAATWRVGMRAVERGLWR